MPVRLQPSADGRELVVVPRRALRAGAPLRAARHGTRGPHGVRPDAAAAHRAGAPPARAARGLRAHPPGRPEPAFLASVNQIGFDQTELLVGPVAGDPAHPGELTLWAIGATRGADGVLRPDPAAATAFALRATWRGDRLVASARRARVRFSFGDVPTRRLELRTLLGPDLRPRGAPSLVTETACGGVPVYGPLLRAIQLCNDDDVLGHLGHGDDPPAHRSGHARAGGRPGRRPGAAPPDGRRVGRGHRRAWPGRRCPRARHVVAILLTDADTGAPVDLDLASLTTVAADPDGRVTGVSLRLPAGTKLPGRVAAQVLVDLAPVARTVR